MKKIDIAAYVWPAYTGDTWNAFGANPDDDLGYGDHVFISTNTVSKVYDVLIEESKIDGVAISDHYPIVVEFYY